MKTGIATVRKQKAERVERVEAESRVAEGRSTERMCSVRALG